MRFALLQFCGTVGDIQGNVDRILTLTRKAAGMGAEVCVTPELAISGYPPGDLLSFQALHDELEKAEQTIVRELAGTDVALALGTSARNPASDGRKIFNQAVFIYGGAVLARYNKRLLPFYECFDEGRYFEPGTESCVVVHKGVRLALCVCEDIWNNAELKSVRNYALDPIACNPPFDVLVNLSASPFLRAKQQMRETTMSFLSRSYNAAVLYANAAGANDSLVFDGRSICAMPDGSLAARGKPFAEDIVMFDAAAGKGTFAADLTAEDEVWAALTLGVKDYCRKMHMGKALLDMTNGSNSALVAAIACEALGPENVMGVFLSSPDLHQDCLAGAGETARNLGMRTMTLSGDAVSRAFDATLSPLCAAPAADAPGEKNRDRVKSAVLTALSDRCNAVLLSTNNKSNLALGNCIIDDSAAASIAAIGDLYQTEVAALCRHLNERRQGIIPQCLNEEDRHPLPPYEELDAVLKAIIEERLSAREICAKGFAPETVRCVANLVAKAECKRYQAPPVLKTSRNAFGPGWRMPVACNPAYL